MDFEIIDFETGKVIGHADCGFTSEEEAKDYFAI